jgi:hypothetical protein
VLTSFHGGVWLFPPPMEDPRRGVDEYAVLVAILEGLDDPAAYVTTPSQAPK